MIDDLTILMTSLVIVFVVYRAFQLDQIIPWFKAEALPDDAKQVSSDSDIAMPVWRRTRRRYQPSTSTAPLPRTGRRGG